MFQTLTRHYPDSMQYVECLCFLSQNASCQKFQEALGNVFSGVEN
jgi:hypothetical protein